MNINIREDFKSLIPPLKEEEYALLEASIVREGCRDPLVVCGDVIIDGHNRYEICIKHNIPFQVVSIFFDSEFEVKLWMIRNQRGRRNLTTLDLVNLALAEKSLFAEDAKQRQLEQLKRGDAVSAPVRQREDYGKTSEKLSESFGVGSRTIEQVSKIKEVAPERLEEIRSDKKSIKAVYMDIMREQNREKREQEYKDNPLPEDVFDVILADPPWRYDYCPTESREIENHYPTMDLEDIKALRIPAAEDSILFLWATVPLMFDALEVIRAWGFTYKGQFVWDKVKMGMGFWNRIQHETLYIAIKGVFKAPNPENRQRSVIQAPYEEHSKKPGIVYDMIEQMYPGKKYLELFARRKHGDNWAAWGNEL